MGQLLFHFGHVCLFIVFRQTMGVEVEHPKLKETKSE